MLTRRFVRRGAALGGLLALATVWACTTELPTGLQHVNTPTSNVLLNGVVVPSNAGDFTVTPLAPNNSGRAASEFWDNISADGPNDATNACNIGFFAKATLGGCNNKAVGTDANSAANAGVFTTFLGTAGGNGAAGWTFNGVNTYSVKFVGAISGASAGDNEVGWYDVVGGVRTFHPVADWGNKNAAGAPVVIGPLAAGTNWGVYIAGNTTPAGGCGVGINGKQASCTDATGGFTAAPQQLFALFSNALQTKFLVGMEDVAVTSIASFGGPDADYNDYILQIDAVVAPPIEVCPYNPQLLITDPLCVPPPPPVVALFVIGDVEPHAVGKTVNFWGAQWWKNNDMSGIVSNGVASFKGYADQVTGSCGGTWTSHPGNSSNPPSIIPADVAIIVTTKVIKNGNNISGDIKQIVMVHHDGGYGPNPGHRGNGPVTSIVCTAP